MFKHMAEIRKELGTDTVIVSLSLGKDSIATLILCHMVFNKIYCMFGEQLPGRKRDRVYADYLWSKFPKIKDIKFYPHPVFVNYWSEGMFRKHDQIQDPFYETGIDEERTEYKTTYVDYGNHMLLEHNIDPTNIYQAVGVKMSDSLNRRIALTKIGYINHKNKVIYPIRDFSTKAVYELLEYKNIKLHPDYKYYGSTFEGMAAKYWVNAYRKDPETWKLLETYFPMAKAYVYKDIFKRQMNQQLMENINAKN